MTIVQLLNTELAVARQQQAVGNGKSNSAVPYPPPSHPNSNLCDLFVIEKKTLNHNHKNLVSKIERNYNLIFINKLQRLLSPKSVLGRRSGSGDDVSARAVFQVLGGK